LLRALERGQAGEVYNIGGNNERSNLELTRMILDLMGRDASWIEHVPDRLGHDLRYAIDASKIARQLCWEPTRSTWPSALHCTIKWYEENRQWWVPLKQKE
jgi:dTDP-glucose 4,6-dehydratase